MQDSKLTFHTPPPYGAVITGIMQLPTLYITKELPLPGTMVLVDNKISMATVRPDAYSTYNTLTSEESVYIQGPVKKEICVETKKDAYIGDITVDEDTVLYVKARMIFLANEKISEIENVILHSDAQEILSLKDIPDVYRLGCTFIDDNNIYMYYPENFCRKTVTKRCIQSLEE
jgi:hypothetical protein